MKRDCLRRGAALVEMAMVVVIFMMLLFGIIEYCRFIFIRQLVTNAAREGARYAVVNTTDSTIETDTKAFVKVKMAGFDGKSSNYNCQVFLADGNGNYLGAAANAQFGQYVAVQVDYDYNPILPSFLFMGKTIKISSKSLMYSEAN